MHDSERLRRMSEELEMPVQVSAGNGAVRGMADRIDEARGTLGVTRGTPSCGGVMGGWGD